MLLKKDSSHTETGTDYPTPGTLATCMYYTGIDPRNMKPVYVAKTYEEKLEQRALMQFSYPKNYDIVYRALKKRHIA